MKTEEIQAIKHLSAEQVVQTFQKEGSVFLPGFFTPEECLGLKKHYKATIKHNEGLFYRIKSNQPEKNIFTASGFVVNPFMNLHLDENETIATPFRNFLESEKIDHQMSLLLGENYELLKSMYFESNRGTERHFDTDMFGPESQMVGMWVALEEITPENGGFFYYPKTHSLWNRNFPDPKLKDMFNEYRMYAALKKEGYANMDKSALLSIYKKGNKILSDIIEEMGTEQVSHTYQPGDMVLFDGKLLHGSFRPTNYEQSRNSLSAHFI